MKKLICGVVVVLAMQVRASVDMTRVDAAIFIHRPETDFSKIIANDESRKERLVRYLFDHDLIDHEGTRAFATDAQFAPYFKAFRDRYKLIDLNNDGVPELVFAGLVSADDDREHVAIFDVKKGIPTCIYLELGHLLAYRVQPNTGEILLYHHQYPCCLNASHTISRLRLVSGKLQAIKRYFVAREAGDMKGRFFPESTRFTGKLYRTTSREALRWSPEIITRDAWQGRTGENRIANYPKGALYCVLARENGWMYVRMQTPPLSESGNRVINPANFSETAIYGWLKEKKD